jgi:nucleoid-associated protein YgaU
MSIKKHTVRPGETLDSIAKAYYGDGDLDTYIFQHNSTIIKDINRIYPGQVITIPHLPLLRWVEE